MWHCGKHLQPSRPRRVVLRRVVLQIMGISKDVNDLCAPGWQGHLRIARLLLHPKSRLCFQTAIRARLYDTFGEMQFHRCTRFTPRYWRAPCPPSGCHQLILECLSGWHRPSTSRNTLIFLCGASIMSRIHSQVAKKRKGLYGYRWGNGIK